MSVIGIEELARNRHIKGCRQLTEVQQATIGYAVAANGLAPTLVWLKGFFWVAMLTRLFVVKTAFDFVVVFEFMMSSSIFRSNGR